MKLASNASLALMASTNCPNGHRGTPEELITNATNAEHRRVLSELEHLLQATGCPACRYIEGIERSFFS